MAGLRNAALIERDYELSLIDQAIRVVAGGSSRVMVLKGAAGMGKTRLLGALRERSRAAGFQDLAAHSSPLERSYPFGVARQLFQPALASLDGEQRAGLLSGLARAAAHPLALTSTAGRGGEDAMYAALHGLYWLCVIWPLAPRWRSRSMMPTGLMTHRCDSSRSPPRASKASPS